MPMLRNATEMRLNEANAAGGIHGRQLRFIVEDNGSQPQLAVRAAQKLIRQDEVFAFLNPFGSGTNAATLGMAMESDTVVFAPWGASAAFQQVAQRNPLLFTTVQDYHTTTARALARVMPEGGASRLGVLYMEGPFGDLIRAGVNMAMQQMGMTVAEEAAYRPGDIDFSSQVARLRAADCDLVLAGTVIRETVGVMSEVSKLDWDVNVLTAIPGRSTVVARLGGADAEGLYGIGGWRLHGADTTDTDAQDFIARFQAAYGMMPDENAANAYSYTDWFVKGLDAAGRDLTPESFVAAMRGVRHADFTTYAELHFENNHAMPELVSIDRIQGGVWVPTGEPF
jgi:ABC-type branched-subunit amino acid transport system substrate-binding protein